MEALTREFVPRYPEIKLEISITDRHVDLIREGYDVALRVGEMGNVDWMVRRLATLQPILVAAPQWLERVAHPATPEELPHLTRSDTRRVGIGCGWNGIYLGS